MIAARTLEHALFVASSIEAPPRDLHARADEVSVSLTWGALLRGVVRASTDVLDRLALPRVAAQPVSFRSQELSRTEHACQSMTRWSHDAPVERSVYTSQTMPSAVRSVR